MDFKNISREEIKELLNSKDKTCFKAGAILNRISSDLEAMMFVSMTGVIEVICRDLDQIAAAGEKYDLPKDDDIQGLINWRDITKIFVGGSGILSDSKDSKIFERINLFMKNYPEYSKAIATGVARLKELDVIDKEENVESDIFTQKANERRNNKTKA